MFQNRFRFNSSSESESVNGSPEGPVSPAIDPSSDVKASSRLEAETSASSLDLQDTIRSMIQRQLHSSPDPTPLGQIEERPFGQGNWSESTAPSHDLPAPQAQLEQSRSTSEYEAQNSSLDHFQLLKTGKKMYQKQMEKRSRYRKLTRTPDLKKEEEPEKPHNPQSFKRVLCFNMLNRGQCSYGSKCVYAHSLNEQKVDESRKNAYDLLQSQGDLSELDLLKNRNLHSALMQLTKMCLLCAKGVCPGGYNCKYGSYCKQYQICYHDYMNGECSDHECLLTHLSKRGLVPYNVQKIRGKLRDHLPPQRRLRYHRLDDLRTGNIEPAKPKPGEIRSHRYIKPPVPGMVLSENYFSRQQSKKLNYSDSLSEISMEEDEAERLKDFIHNPQEEELPEPHMFLERDDSIDSTSPSEISTVDLVEVMEMLNLKN